MPSPVPGGDLESGMPRLLLLTLLLGILAPPGRAEAADFIQSRLKKALLLTYNNFHGPTTQETQDLLAKIAKEKGFTLDIVPTGEKFTDAGLADYQVVIFIQNRSFNLTDAQKAAFERWYRKGNGALCTHACTLDQGWPYYKKILGTSLAPHSDIIATDVGVPGKNHPILKGYGGEKLNWDDEWFYWTSDPTKEPGVEVLLTVSFTAFPPQQYPVPTLNGKPYDVYPNAWVKHTDGGRFLTWGGTHTTTAKTRYPDFTYNFYFNGLKYVAGRDTVATCTNPSMCEPAGGTSGIRGIRTGLESGPGSIRGIYRIIDIQGRVVFRRDKADPSGPGPNPISPAGLSKPGIYFMVTEVGQVGKTGKVARVVKRLSLVGNLNP